VSALDRSRPVELQKRLDQDSVIVRTMPAGDTEFDVQTDERSADTEPWVSALRRNLLDSGFDPSRVDQVITTTLERFRSSRIRDFIPLLVERAVYGALRGQG
jgi:hypothetical protein